MMTVFVLNSEDMCSEVRFLHYLCKRNWNWHMKIKKNQYLAGFAIVVFLLALTRWIFPDIAKDRNSAQTPAVSENHMQKDSLNHQQPVVLPMGGVAFLDSSGQALHHRIVSVPSYSEAFPDSNYVQIEAAMQWGVSPVSNRQDAEARKNELVYVGASPYYHVDPMKQSIPYLVPRAAVLLQDIGHCFYDSLQLKGVPIHQFIVTSVLRTRDDVEKLRNYNKNATENSCHLYGTTFDISYNRYVTVQAPGEHRREVPSDTLKWVLSEVLNDLRNEGRCYVKYEVKQSCFHITTR